jgi:hypothetical protein
MRFVYLALFVICGFSLVACGEETSTSVSTTPVAQSTVAEIVQQGARIKPVANSGDDVSVRILSEDPTSTGCLQAVIQGVPGRSGVIWTVNDTVVASGTETKLCNDHYGRGDQVTVQVGTTDQGATASVKIANSPPRVVDISSTPDEIYAGTEISVTPVAEDIDGDEVDFTYQWLINGEADPKLTESVLPGEMVSKGNMIQVQIIPNDFYEDGPTYESYAQPVPNAAPRVTSAPPEGIASLDYRYQVEVTDPDDTQFTYRLDEGPEGMTIDPASGLISWSLVDVAPGDYTITIIVTDPEGAEGAQGYTLSLGAPQ